MDIITLAQKRAAATELLRLKPESMTPAELNFALALLLRLNIRPAHVSDNPEENEPLQVQAGQTFVEFSPMTDWNDLSQVLTKVGLVTGSHEIKDAKENVTGCWYSCHGYFGGIEAEGYDMPTVIGITGAKLLGHNLKYSDIWKVEKAD